MNSEEKFTYLSCVCSKSLTEGYSTSFSLAIRLLHKNLRRHIHAIYGFVRLADEIVDTFHQHDKRSLLKNLQTQTEEAIREKISLNPLLQSFQYTVNYYNIPEELISSFLKSMEMDLDKSSYNSNEELSEYIYGSAEVVGLMCLKVFCEGDDTLYQSLREYACKLGAAFQKINFLRDLEDDTHQLNRQYFPKVDVLHFDEKTKKILENDIEADFKTALPGILKLPGKTRFGVYLAYRYYLSLFYKIRKNPPSFITKQRVRVPNLQKLVILFDAGLRNQFGYW